MRLAFRKGLRCVFGGKRRALQGQREQAFVDRGEADADWQELWAAELEEFLAGDRSSTPVDLFWKDVLRDHLWQLLESRRLATRGDPEQAREEKVEA